MHLESTKLWIDEFVATVLPAGTTAVAADPHELANVLGVPGDPRADGGGRARCRSPSPSTRRAACPPLRSSRPEPTLDASDIAELITRHGARGVAEVMNFPGVIAGDEEMLARVAVAGRPARRRPQPGRVGAAAGRLPRRRGRVRPREHDCSPRPKRSAARGCGCSCARGPPARTWWTLAPSVVAHGTDQAAFCTDDREPDTLRRLGHINDCARLAVANGISEIEAILLASHQPGPLSRLRRARQPRPRSPGRHPRLLGARDLACPTASGSAGAAVVTGGALMPGAVPAAPVPDLLRDTVNIGVLPGADALVLPVALGTTRARDRGREPQPHHAADRARGRARRRPRPRRGGRAPPRHRAGRARIRHGLRAAARGDRLDRRPRRTQPRRRRPLRGGHAQSPSPGWPRSAAGRWRCSTAPSWPRCRSRSPG